MYYDSCFPINFSLSLLIVAPLHAQKLTNVTNVSRVVAPCSFILGF